MLESTGWLWSTSGKADMQLLMRDRAKLVDAAISSRRVQVTLAKGVSHVVQFVYILDA